MEIFPEFMNLSDIKPIYKSKGSRLDVDNERGISLLTVFKKVFENLMFGEFSQDIDKNMSDLNIGSRQKRNIKDHLIIIHGIINSVNKGEDDCVDLLYLT